MAGAKRVSSVATRSRVAEPLFAAGIWPATCQPAHAMADATIKAESRITWPPSLDLLVLQRGVHLLAFQPRAPVQCDELDQEGERVDRSANLPDERRRGACGAASGQQVVHDQHALPLFDGVFMNL